MKPESIIEHHADVVIIGVGAAGACAAIEAHNAGVSTVILEKQPGYRHYSKAERH